MRQVTLRAIARGQTPGIRPVSREVFGIVDAIGSVNERPLAVVLKIRRSKAVVQTVRIESEVRVMREKQRPSRSHAYIQLDSVIGVAVGVVISIPTARPSRPIVQRVLRLPRPSGVIQIRGNAVRRR